MNINQSQLFWCEQKGTYQATRVCFPSLFRRSRLIENWWAEITTKNYSGPVFSNNAVQKGKPQNDHLSRKGDDKPRRIRAYPIIRQSRSVLSMSAMASAGAQVMFGWLPRPKLPHSYQLPEDQDAIVPRCEDWATRGSSCPSGCILRPEIDGIPSPVFFLELGQFRIKRWFVFQVSIRSNQSMCSWNAPPL